MPLPPLPDPETAPPEPTDGARGPAWCASTGIGLELGAESNFDVPYRRGRSAQRRRRNVADGDSCPRRLAVRIETLMRMSCTQDAFLLQATLRAQEGAKRSVIGNGIIRSLGTSCEHQRRRREDGRGACLTRREARARNRSETEINMPHSEEL